MTPTERAKWCLQQADEAERELPPLEDAEIIPIGHFVPAWWRELAFAAVEGEGPETPQ